MAITLIGFYEKYFDPEVWTLYYGKYYDLEV